MCIQKCFFFLFLLLQKSQKYCFILQLNMNFILFLAITFSYMAGHYIGNCILNGKKLFWPDSNFIARYFHCQMDVFRYFQIKSYIGQISFTLARRSLCRLTIKEGSIIILMFEHLMEFYQCVQNPEKSVIVAVNSWIEKG